MYNVHVFPIKKPKTDNVREMYGTRRKEKIELASFDTSNSFKLISNKVDSKPKHSSDSDSTSNDEDKFNSRSQPQKKSTKEFHFCSSSSFEEDVTLKSTKLKITKPICEDDGEDVVSGIVNETKKDETKKNFYSILSITLKQVNLYNRIRSFSLLKAY